MHAICCLLILTAWAVVHCVEVAGCIGFVEFLSFVSFALDNRVSVQYTHEALKYDVSMLDHLLVV